MVALVAEVPTPRRRDAGADRTDLRTHHDARHMGCEAVDVVDLLPLKPLGGNGRDDHRDAHKRFIPLARSDDDFFRLREGWRRLQGEADGNHR